MGTAHSEDSTATRKIRRARRDPGGTGDGGAEIGHGDDARDGRRLRAPENCSPWGSPRAEEWSGGSP
ncbi:hypothetical protein IscW_ISCW021344 [Ixodes scapularis]|uniref:Uncharacterized protein n=1 Tax=Ixodes scapularis TaxID=6945 RepID=B7Q5X0_IXOSC|nr:hypothetical protein IscW_ISCW021344 [Ixodes scapularis]|eukprot:XP_002402376.1 hypothetical protein IscW_ISCW021344 [Ixodes scapularis]